MNKLLKILGLFLLLISVLTSAQNAKDCINLPDPLKDLIKDPIAKDLIAISDAPINSQLIITNLTNYKTSLIEYSRGAIASDNDIKLIRKNNGVFSLFYDRKPHCPV